MNTNYERRSVRAMKGDFVDHMTDICRTGLDYGLEGGEHIRISTVKGLNFLGDSGTDGRAKARSRINSIIVVKEFENFILLQLDVSDNHNTYYESINKAAIKAGDAYMEVIRDVEDE